MSPFDTMWHLATQENHHEREQNHRHPGGRAESHRPDRTYRHSPPGHDLGHQPDLRNGRHYAGVRVCGAARPEGDALSHSSGRPRGQRQELLEPKEPSGCCASACRRHRPVGPGSRNTPPAMGPSPPSGRGGPAPIERACRLRELVRRSGHLAGRGGRQRRSTIPDLAGGQDAPPEAT